MASFGFGGRLAVMLPVPRKPINPQLLSPDDVARYLDLGCTHFLLIVDAKRDLNLAAAFLSKFHMILKWFCVLF